MSGGYHPWSKFNAHRWSDLNARRQAPKLAAINAALRVMERRAKLLGLDKPTKLAATDPSGNIPAQVVHFYLPDNGRDGS